MSWVPNAPSGLAVLPAFVNTPIISTSSLPSGEAGAAYSFQLVGTGGTQPYTWSASGLPSGMSCTAAGLLTGTPTAAFSGNVTINLTDANSASAPPRVLALSIIAGPVVSTTSLSQATVGVFYSFQMAATGGTPPYTWAASGLPAGLGINSAGLITGTPTASGSPTVVFTATDALGVASPGKSLTLTVQAAGASGFITHLQVVTVTVPGTFTKSSGVAAPIVRDYGQDGPGAVNAGWAGVQPNNTGTGVITANNMQNRALNFVDTGGFVPGAPHPFVQGILGASAYNGTTNPSLSAKLAVSPIPAFPFSMYGCGYIRATTAWTFATGAGAGNFKFIAYDNNVAGPNEQVFVPDTFVTSPLITFGLEINNNGLPPNNVPPGHALEGQNGGPAPASTTDANGRSLFCGGNFPNPLNPATGWIPIEWEIGFSQTPWAVSSSSAPTGFVKLWIKGQLDMSNSQPYIGKTDDNTGNLRCIAFGMPTSFTKMSGSATFENNWGYGADWYCDASGSVTAAPVSTSLGGANTFTCGSTERIYFSNQATYDETVQSVRFPAVMQALPSPSGANTTVPIQFWQGMFPLGSTVYAHARKSDGTVASNLSPGPWVVTIVPDVFISTTGNDSNPGTLAAPWAITSLVPTSANQSKMAGKKVGLIAGTYTTAGLPQQSGSFAYSILTVPDGTGPTTPTHLMSCDANGHYAPRKAIILGPGGTCPNGILGNNQSDTSKYITIDGIVIDGNGTVANSTGGGHVIHFLTVNYNRSSSLQATAPGWSVINCELRNLNPQGSNSYLGGNYAFVFMAGGIQPVIQNNLMHDMLYSGTPAQDPGGVAVSHQGATCMIGCQNALTTLNTVYNCTMGIWDKEGNTGSVVSYNYIYNTALGADEVQAGYNSAIIGYDGQAGNPNPGPAPTTQFFHHNVIEACGPAHVFVENFGTTGVASTIPVVAYNNTVYETNTAAQRGWSMNTNQGQAQFYNNIYYSTNASGGSPGSTYQGKLSITSGNFSTVSNNCYHSSGAQTNWWQLVTGGSTAQFSTLAAWQTGSGVDANSITADPSFVLPGGFIPGGGAAQFKLNTGSPCFTTGVGNANMGAWDGTSTQIGCNFTTGN